MEKTIFQKIIDREIPADIAYEDDICIAFLDNTPVKKGHLLFISKKPYPWIEQVSDEELVHMTLITKKIVLAMKSDLSADYVQVTVMGTEVPHFHIHLIPHTFSDPVVSSHERSVEQYRDTIERDYYRETLCNALQKNSL